MWPVSVPEADEADPDRTCSTVHRSPFLTKSVAVVGSLRSLRRVTMVSPAATSVLEASVPVENVGAALDVAGYRDAPPG